MDNQIFWGKALDIDYYDADRKRNNKERYTAPAQPSANLFNEFANVMMSVMSQMAGMNMRGGHSGPSSGYRGGAQYNRGTRGNNRGGQRGATRGGGRGGSRGGPSGYYNTRSQYQQKPMMGGAMGMPPLGGGMVPPMGGMPPMGSQMAGPGYVQQEQPMPQPSQMNMMPPMQQPMQAPIQPQAPPKQQVEETVDSEEEFVMSLKKEEYSDHENEIGTFLYNKIEVTHGADMAGRIAGMFLDLPAEEVESILHSKESYNKYIADAENLIKQDMAGAQ